MLEYQMKLRLIYCRQELYRRKWHLTLQWLPMVISILLMLILIMINASVANMVMADRLFSMTI